MSVSEMPTASGVPTDEAQRPILMPSSRKKVRPFAAVDNPSLSPNYDSRMSPSPVQDWTLQDVSEDPTDQPQYAPRSRGHSQSQSHNGGNASGQTDDAARDSDMHEDNSDLKNLDSLLIESEGLESEFGTRTRDWLPNDFEHPPPEASPKKRRVERMVHDEMLDMPMQMGLPPLELDLENPNVVDIDVVGVHDVNDMGFEHGHDHHVYEYDMHPDLAFSYEDEEDMHIPMHAHPRAHHHPRAYPHPHPHMHPHAHPSAMPQRSPYARRQVLMHIPHPHAHEYIHEMELYPHEEQEAVPAAAPSARRSPAASPTASPSQMQGRRVVGPGMGRGPVRQAAYRPRYMNAYVPGVPVPMGGGRAYYRRGYTRHHPYGRYMNPANLPSPRTRKAYHLPPMGQHPDRRGNNGAAPYFFSSPEEDPFWEQHGFFSADGAAMAPVDVAVEQQSPTSVTALDRTLQDPASRSNSSDAKKMSLPTIKLSSPDASPKLTPEGDEKKPSTMEAAASATNGGRDEEDLKVVDFRTGKHISLSIDEDANWLSEFQSYVRMEFLEIFRASHEDVKFRNTSRKVAYKQLGIRCRFCAHIHPGSRARRSSAYPSSTAQIYQSFNMMIRDHFPRCESVPKEKMDVFHQLKGRNNQGAADSKHFWSYAAEKLGMVDSEAGIYMNDATQQAAVTKSPFSTTNTTLVASRCPPVLLVFPEDKPLISPFLFELLSRVQRVHLLDCECRSTRKNLKVGLPGFGCRYCCEAGRLGFSRIFPTKRKGLPEKANDMYEHFRRCTLCPPEVKQRLERLRPKPEEVCTSTEKVFFDRVWTRLNGGSQP